MSCSQCVLMCVCEACVGQRRGTNSCDKQLFDFLACGEYGAAGSQIVLRMRHLSLRTYVYKPIIHVVSI